MSKGEIAYLALVLGAVAAFVVGVIYAYVSSLRARRAKAGAVTEPPARSALDGRAPEFRKAA